MGGAFGGGGRPAGARGGGGGLGREAAGGGPGGGGGFFAAAVLSRRSAGGGPGGGGGRTMVADAIPTLSDNAVDSVFTMMIVGLFRATRLRQQTTLLETRNNKQTPSVGCRQTRRKCGSVDLSLS